MNPPPRRWPARRTLALLCMSLLLGAPGSEAEAVSKATRDAQAGRVFFLPAHSHDTYDSFIIYVQDDAATDDHASAKAQSKRRQLDRALDSAGRALGVGLVYRQRISTGGHLVELSGKSAGLLGRTMDAEQANQLMLELASDPALSSIEANIRLQALVNDPMVNLQWALYEAIGGINLNPAWAVGASGSGVTIAVIDTGQTSHPDLDSKTLAGADLISDPGNARDGTGRDADPADMGDWNTTGQCGPTAGGRNSTWHGTHVAGIAAALTDNAVGIAGVAFGSSLQHVRVLGACGGTTVDIADGIVWASGGAVSGLGNNPTPAKVLNLSLGGESACTTTYQNAINTARANGSVMIVAAGNDTLPASRFTPANCSGVISIASNTRSGGRANYSNYGSTIDLAAPGGDSNNGAANGIWSTVNSGSTSPISADYAYKDGTSMAAPYVAGIAALMKGRNPALTPDQIETLLKDTARPFPITCFGGCGTGIVDAGAAVAASDGGAIAQMPISVSVYSNDNGSGTVTSSPAGINCATLTSGPGCSARFATNSSVTLTATAQAGSVLEGWFGPCSGSSPTCTVSMQHAASVYALFGPPLMPLSNGVAVSNLSASSPNALRFSFVVPSGASNLNITLSGGSGDADLYVRRGSMPVADGSSWDCRPFLLGNNESCTAASPTAGTYFMLVAAAQNFAGAQLVASYTGGGGALIFCNGMEDGVNSCATN